MSEAKMVQGDGGLEPGKPNCLLLIDGQERQLRPWDFVHCPPQETDSSKQAYARFPEWTPGRPVDDRLPW